MMVNGQHIEGDSLISLVYGIVQQKQLTNTDNDFTNTRNGYANKGKIFRVLFVKKIL